MQLRKLLSALLCAALCTGPALAVAMDEGPADNAATKATASPADWQLPQSATVPNLYGAYAALLCADTGQLLLGKATDTPTPPASITKVMTALVVLQHCSDLSVKTTVSAAAVNAVEWNSTHIGLKAGEVVTLEQMMAAMLIHSANDAANVLAEHVGGSLTGFAQMMNDEAAALGCTHTHFANANGLDDPQHYTSAHDMALIGQAVVKYPAFTQFAGAIQYTMPATNLSPDARTFYTKQNILCHNPQQYYYAGAFAGKNGWTTNAHQTLITFARRNDVTLVAVTMKSDSRYPKVLDTIAMFNYGFQNFSMQTISAQTQAESVKGVISDCDTKALTDQKILLPNGVTPDMLQLKATGGASPSIAVSLDGQKLLELSVPLKAQAAAGTGARQSTAPLSLSPRRILVVAAGGLAAVFCLLLAYRTFRIRRQRRLMRRRYRQGHKTQRDGNPPLDVDLFKDP